MLLTETVLEQYEDTRRPQPNRVTKHVWEKLFVEKEINTYKGLDSN